MTKLTALMLFLTLTGCYASHVAPVPDGAPCEAPDAATPYVVPTPPRHCQVGPCHGDAAVFDVPDAGPCPMIDPATLAAWR